MLDTFHLTLEFAPADEADDPFAVRTGTQDYLLRSGQGEYTTVSLKWNQALFDDLAALRAPGRDPALVQAMGERLRRFVAPSGWQQALAGLVEASTEGRTVIITIRSAAAEIYQLPWELMTLQSGRHLGALEHVLFRYEWPRTRTTPRVPSGEGGRIAFAWSAAGGTVPAGRHQQLIAEACQRGTWSFDPAKDQVAHATLEDLAALVAQPDLAILHLLAHGAQAGESAYGLAIDARDGGRVILDPGRLRELIAPQAGHLRLVVVCACDSGNQGVVGNPLGSIAQALHAAGVATVIASRFPLSVDGAALLTEALYDSLLDGPTSVETALLKARRRLLAESATLDWASIQLYARAADGDDSRPLIIRPFRGLLAYQPPDARFFFGRDGERAELLADLEALRTTGKPRLLVIAGASGTGKSSMVLAGAVPDLLGHHEAAYHRDESVKVEQIIEALRRLLPTYDPPAVRQSLNLLVQLAPGAKSSVSGWQYHVFRPGGRPLEALDETIGDLNVQQGPVLLIVDQFEEIFTQCERPRDREIFAKRLWSFARLPDAQTHVLITIRVDYLGQCGELVIDEAGTRLDRVAYDEAHRVFVAQMGPRQMRAAIEEPAHKVGLKLEPGLVERMLADVEGEPGALPLLSYTLDLLWQGREGRVLTQAAYDALGGVAGALHGRADAIIDALNDLEQHQARRLLVRLVAVEDGAWDARRRVRIAEVRPALLWHVPFFEIALAALVDARLLVQGQEGRHPTVELAHEALIRRWTRLREWIVADQQMLAQVKTVERWTDEWRRFRRLLVDDQLGFAAKVREDFGAELSEDARKLIDESEGAVRRAANRRRRLTIGFMGLAVTTAIVMLALGIWGLSQKTEADKNAREALEKAKTARKERDRATSATRVSVARGQELRDPLLASLFLLEFAGRNGATALDDPDELEEDVPPEGGLSLARRLASRAVPARRLDPAHLIREERPSAIHYGRSGEVLTVSNGIARIHDLRGSRRVTCDASTQYAVVQSAFALDGQSARGRAIALLEEHQRGKIVDRRLCAVDQDGDALDLPLGAGLAAPTTIVVDQLGEQVSAVWSGLSCQRAALAAQTFESMGDAVSFPWRVAESLGEATTPACALVARWSLTDGARQVQVLDDQTLESVEVTPDGRQAVAVGSRGGAALIDLANLEVNDLLLGEDARAIRFTDDAQHVVARTAAGFLVWRIADGDLPPQRIERSRNAPIADFQIRGEVKAWRRVQKRSQLVIEAAHGEYQEDIADATQVVLVEGDSTRARVGLLVPGVHWKFRDVALDLPDSHGPVASVESILGRDGLALDDEDEEDAPPARANAARVKLRKAPKPAAERKSDLDGLGWADSEAQLNQTRARRQQLGEEREAPPPAPPEIRQKEAAGPERDVGAGVVRSAEPPPEGLPPRETVIIEACATDVRSTLLDPRGRYLLVTTPTEVCLVPTTDDGRLTRLTSPGVVAAEFRADGRMVALLSSDGSSAIWPTEAGSPQKLPGTRRIVRAWFPDSIPDGSPVLYGLDDEATLHRWRMDADLFEELPLNPVPQVLQVSADGRHAVAVDGRVAVLVDLWAPPGPATLPALEHLRPEGKPVEFSPSGRWLSQINAEGVRLWDLTTLTAILVPSTETVQRFAITPDATRAVAVTDRSLSLWRLDESATKLDEIAVERGSTVQFSHDSAHILLGEPRTVTRLHVGKLQERFHFEVPADLVLEPPRLSPDNRFVVASAALDGPPDRILVWRLDGSDGGKPQVVRGQDATDDYQIEGWDFAMRVTHLIEGDRVDRPHLLIRSNTGVIERRRLDRFGLDGVMPGHASVVDSLVYHPSGRMVTHDADDVVRLWLARDVSGAAGFLSGQFDSQVLDDGPGQIEDAVFSPDGDWVVVRTRYDTIWAWRLGWASLMRLLRERTDECLTAGERVRYLGGRWDQAQAEASACPPPQPR